MQRTRNITKLKKKDKTWMEKMKANYIKCFMDGKMDRYYKK